MVIRTRATECRRNTDRVEEKLAECGDWPRIGRGKKRDLSEGPKCSKVAFEGNFFFYFVFQSERHV